MLPHDSLFYTHSERPDQIYELYRSQGEITLNHQIPGEVERVRKAGHEILEVCAEAGGTITGEHGVGIEKQEEMALIFNEVDLRVMQQVREAWNPRQLFNPGKLFPMPGRCA